jgi:hypothetical protein
MGKCRGNAKGKDEAMRKCRVNAKVLVEAIGKMQW